MNSGERTGVAGIQELQEVEGFTAANLSEDDAIRPVAKRGLPSFGCSQPFLSFGSASRWPFLLRAAGTISTLIMLHYFNIALDNKVTPSELSEIITHLAFYSGWSNAFAAINIVKDIFEQRGIKADQLPPAGPELLPLN
jgi:hypothetical protein